MIGRNMKNVLVVSFGFVCLFTAYGGLQSLQSSLNAEQGLGVASLSVIYGSLLLSAILLPPLLIKTLGCKWTIVASMTCYLTYSFGNLYSGWESLIPTSAVLGLAGGPLWSAKCTYLTLSAQRQAQEEEGAGEGHKEATDAKGHRENTEDTTEGTDSEGRRKDANTEGHRQDLGRQSEEATDRAGCGDGHVSGETTDTVGGKETTTDRCNNIRESREARNGSNNATGGEANGETIDREGRREFRGRGYNSKDSRETGDGTNDISRDGGHSCIDGEGSREDREEAREEGRGGNLSQLAKERDGREEGRGGNLREAREDRVGKLSQQAQDLLSQYFGIFFAMFQSSAIWGNLLSSLIFSQDTHVADISEEALQYCGVGLCADELIQSGNATRPEQKLVYTLMGCYIGMGLVAMASVAIFLDNIDGDVAKEFRGSGQSLCSTAMATVRLLSDRKLQLLVPMTIYSGLEQSFLWAEFTKNYVTCALGIHVIGFSMICFGACNSVSSFLSGKIAPLTGRMVMFGLAALTNFCCIMGLLFWRPHPDHFAVFFLVAGLWGMADGILQTQINATYGVLFPDHKEAAFANIRLWESAGFLLAFGYSSHLCLSTKTYLLLSALGLSLLTYPLLELLVRRGRIGCCRPPQQQGEQSAEHGTGDAVHMNSSL